MHPGGRTLLANYSLAISYLAFLTSASAYTFTTGGGTPVNNDNVTVSDSFSFGSNGAQYASAILKGNYQMNGSSSASTSCTMPIGQFQDIYTSDSGGGQSVGFQINTQMYFLAIGFPHWGGYQISQDPTYSAVSAISGHSTGGTGSGSGGSTSTVSVGPSSIHPASGFTTDMVLALVTIISPAMIVIRHRRTKL